eukprot:TRINITY_DN5826_c0_g1_i2.p1 TRINITY_DN5826_c0_g1~~TRINITY_DN5826_c0_g1_i2.p1  ORF type:complete len:1823 (+),score=632.44 TRINITY_DN5826_c0_g1_i2:662-5470(+)
MAAVQREAANDIIDARQRERELEALCTEKTDAHVSAAERATAADSENEMLRAQLDEASAELRQVKEEVRGCIDEVTGLSEDRKMLQAAIALKTQEALQAKDDCDAMGLRIAAFEEDIKRCESELDDARRENASAEVAQTRFAEEEQRLVDALAAAVGTAARLDATLQDTLEAHTADGDRAAHVEDELQRAVVARDSARGEVARLVRVLGETQEGAKAQEEALSTQLRDAGQHLHDVTALHTRREAAVAEAAARYGLQAEEAAAALRFALAHIAAISTALTEEKGQLAADLSAAYDAAASKCSEVDGLRAALSAMEAQRDAKAAEKLKVSEMMAELDAEVGDLKATAAEKDRLAAALCASEVATAARGSEAEELRARLSDMTAERDATAGELKAAAAERERLAEALSVSQDAAAKGREAAEELQGEVSALEEALRTKAAELEHLALEKTHQAAELHRDAAECARLEEQEVALRALRTLAAVEATQRYGHLQSLQQGCAHAAARADAEARAGRVSAVALACENAESEGRWGVSDRWFAGLLQIAAMQRAECVVASTALAHEGDDSADSVLLDAEAQGWRTVDAACSPFVSTATPARHAPPCSTVERLEAQARREQISDEAACRIAACAATVHSIARRMHSNSGGEPAEVVEEAAETLLLSVPVSNLNVSLEALRSPSLVSSMTPSKHPWRIELDEEIVRARAELDAEFSQKIAELQESLDQATERRQLADVLEVELREARDESHALKRMVLELRADAHEATLHAQGAQQRAEELAAAMSELQEQLKSMRERQTQQQADARGQAERNAEHATTAMRDLREAQARVAEQDMRVRELERAVETATRQVACFHTREAALEADLDREKARGEGLRAEEAALKAQLDAAGARRRGLESALAAAEGAQVEVATLKRREAAMAAELRGEREKAEQELQKVQAEAARCQRSEAKCKGRIAVLEGELTEAHGGAEELKAALSEQDRLHKALAAAGEDVKHRKADARKLQAALAKAQKETLQLKMMSDDREARLEAGMKQHEELKAALQAKDERLASVAAELAEARAAVAGLEASLQSKQREGEERLAVVATTLQAVDKTRAAEITRLTETVRRLTPPSSPVALPAAKPLGVLSPRTPVLELDPLKMNEVCRTLGRSNSVLVVSEEELDAWRAPGGEAVQRRHDAATGLSYYSLPDVELDASKLMGFIGGPAAVDTAALRDENDSLRAALKDAHAFLPPQDIARTASIEAGGIPLAMQAVAGALSDLLQHATAEALRGAQSTEDVAAAMARARADLGGDSDAMRRVIGRLGSVAAKALSSAIPFDSLEALRGARDVESFQLAIERACEETGLACAPGVEVVAEAVHVTTINAMADVVLSSLASVLDGRTAAQLRRYAEFGGDAAQEIEGFRVVMEAVGRCVAGQVQGGAIELAAVVSPGGAPGAASPKTLVRRYKRALGELEEEKDALALSCTTARDKMFHFSAQIRTLEAERRHAAEQERATATTAQTLTRENCDLRKRTEELRVQLADAVRTRSAASSAAARSKSLESTASELLAQNREMAIALDHCRSEEKRLRLRNMSLVSKCAALEDSCNTLTQKFHPGAPAVRVEVPPP